MLLVNSLARVLDRCLDIVIHYCKLKEAFVIFKKLEYEKQVYESTVGSSSVAHLGTLFWAKCQHQHANIFTVTVLTC